MKDTQPGPNEINRVVKCKVLSKLKGLVPLEKVTVQLVVDPKDHAVVPTVGVRLDGESVHTWNMEGGVRLKEWECAEDIYKAADEWADMVFKAVVNELESGKSLEAAWSCNRMEVGKAGDGGEFVPDMEVKV